MLGIVAEGTFDMKIMPGYRTFVVEFGPTDEPVNLQKLVPQILRRSPWIDVLLIKGYQGIDPLLFKDYFLLHLAYISDYVDEIPIILKTCGYDSGLLDHIIQNGMVDGVIQDPPINFPGITLDHLEEAKKSRDIIDFMTADASDLQWMDDQKEQYLTKQNGGMQDEFE